MDKWNNHSHQDVAIIKLSENATGGPEGCNDVMFWLLKINLGYAISKNTYGC